MSTEPNSWVVPNWKSLFEKKSTANWDKQQASLSQSFRLVFSKFYLGIIRPKYTCPLFSQFSELLGIV